MPFYNCHIHVFSADCAPKNFLRIGLPKFLNSFAGPIKSGLETRVGTWLVNKMSKIRSKNGTLNTMSRYGAFASVGTLATQKMVFERILDFYPSDSRFVVLTLNMDHMGAGASDLTYQGQIEKVVELRSHYPDACLPFLSLDPRMCGTGEGLLAFAEKYVGPDKPFVGIKLYPALGYFPYDCRLDEVYAFCEKNRIPIMTHCDPGGNFFLGRLNAVLGAPQCMNHGGYSPPPVVFGKKDNNIETERFLEPHAWDVVLAKYPELKICFAHMGGGDALNFDLSKIKVGDDSSLRWYYDIKTLMAAYPNVYTDVSYTLHNNKNWKEILAFTQGRTGLSPKPRWTYLPEGRDPEQFKDQLPKRILFGTDYFMTEREKSEEVLAHELPEWLIKEGSRALYEALTEENPKAYLASAFYQP